MKVKYDPMQRVNKAATNLVPKLKKYSYPDRLKMIGITSLKERRVTYRKGADRFRTVFHASTATLQPERT